MHTVVVVGTMDVVVVQSGPLGAPIATDAEIRASAEIKSILFSLIKRRKPKGTENERVFMTVVQIVVTQFEDTRSFSIMGSHRIVTSASGQETDMSIYFWKMHRW